MHLMMTVTYLYVPNIVFTCKLNKEEEIGTNINWNAMISILNYSATKYS